MIEAKETLIGNISSKKTLTGKINNAIEKVYPELEDITITPSNKEQHFKSNKYGYGSITVESVSAEYIIPTGDLEINSNGTYDVKEKAKAIVNVPEKQLGTKVIDKNGVYNATDDNLDGYSSVEVQTSGADLNEYFQTSGLKSSSSGNYLFWQIIKKFPTIDCSGMNSLSYAFISTQLTEYPKLVNTSQIFNMQNSYYLCSKFSTLEWFDTSGIEIMDSAFYGCSKLTTIPELDASKVNSLSSTFKNCSKLTTFGGLKNLGMAYLTTSSANITKYTLDLSSCSNLTHDSLMSVINGLYDLNLTYNVANGGTLYTQQLVLGSTNLAKLTEEEKAIATNKGWTLS